MTNEEAVKWLRAYPKMTDFTMPQIEEALDMAEKALMEQAQADGEKICGTCRNEDTYHCADCENKSDWEDRNEFYNWDAPIRHKADGEYILKSEAIRVASGYCHPSNIAKELKKLPSVAIPSAEPFDEQVKEYCRRRNLVLVKDEFMVHIIKGTPQAYIYKEMTNGEVIKTVFGDDKVSEFMGYARIMARVGNWFNDGVVAEFDKDWWNSLYEPQESEE